MRTSATEIRSSIPSSSQYSLVSTESVEGTVLHVQSNNTDALAILHDEIKGKVLDEEVGVVAQ